MAGRGWLSAEDREIFAFGESLFLILQQLFSNQDIFVMYI
jgi:hypothetical protein